MSQGRTRKVFMTDKIFNGLKRSMQNLLTLILKKVQDITPKIDCELTIGLSISFRSLLPLSSSPDSSLFLSLPSNQKHEISSASTENNLGLLDQVRTMNMNIQSFV